MGKDSTKAHKRLGIPCCTDTIKEEPKEYDDNQDPNLSEPHIDKESVQEKEKGSEIDINSLENSDKIQEKITETTH